MTNTSYKSHSTKLKLVAGVAIATLALGSQALAQEDTAAVEQIVVTGSSIRGVAPVGSAMIGLGRDAITATAATNTKDLLASVPALGNFGTNAENSTPQRSRTQGYLANIHNLGIYATLTLINGHRVALTGAEGSFADPSSVPTIAIQRVEIIADGASAIYGSDATAGVVNFIYRKPFSGIETQASYSFDGSTRYEKRNVGILGGKLWDRGGFMAAYEYSSNKSPLNSEINRLSTGGDQRAQGGRDLRQNTNCLTPTVRRVLANGGPTGPTYGAASLNFSTNAADQRCGILTPSTIIPDGERHAVVATVEHQITDTVKLWGELNYSHYEGDTIAARPNISVVVPRTNPFFTTANIPAALFNDPTVTRVLVQRSGNGLFGTRQRGGGSSTVTTAVAGIDIDLGADWKGTASLVVSRTRDANSRFGTQLDTVNLATAVADTNRATAINLWADAAGNNPATLARIDIGGTLGAYGQQGMQELQLKADGPVIDLPAGTLRAAVGVSFRASQSNQLEIGGSRAANSGFYNEPRNDHPRQQVSAAFYEVNAPLVSAQNELPFVKELTLSVSGRYDAYDKYDPSFNPKYGVVYSPGLDLRFHASYGTNFNAPNVGLLGSLTGNVRYNSNTNATIGYGPYKGIVLNNINQYRTAGIGGADLTPEEATTKSFGVDWTPTYGILDGLHVGVNWYNVNYTNLFSKVQGTDPITNPAYASLAEFFPSPERTQELIRLYPNSNPITVTQFDYFQDTGVNNLGKRIFEGLDFDISYRLTTDWGLFNAGFTGNRQLKFDQQFLPNTPFESRIGTTDAVKWKGRYTVGWNYENLSVNAFVNYIGSYYNVSVSPFQKVKSSTTVDLTAAYDLGSLGIAKGVTIQGRVANLFDKEPPFYDSADGYDPLQISPFPRSFDITIRAKF